MSQRRHRSSSENGHAVSDLLHENAAIVSRVLNTEDGKRLLDILRQMYDMPLLGPDPQETAYRLGGYDLYRSLVRMKEYNEQVDR